MNKRKLTLQKMALIDGVLRRQKKPIQIKKLAEITGLSTSTVSKLWWVMFNEYHAPIAKDEDGEGIFYTNPNYSIGMDSYLTDYVEQVEKSNEKRKTGLKFTSQEKNKLATNLAIAELLVEKQKQQEENKTVVGKWILRLISEPTKYLMSQTKRGYPVITLDKTRAFVFTDSNKLKQAIKQLGGLFESEVVV